MFDRIRAGIAKLSAIGGVKRRGLGALAAYGGRIQGTGHVIHQDGSRTDIVLDGEPATKGNRK